MTRKEFFKKLGIGVAAIVVAPKVIASSAKEKIAIVKDKISSGIYRYKQQYINPNADMYPHIRDICIDSRDGKKWIIRTIENRWGYGQPDRGMVGLIPYETPVKEWCKIRVKRISIQFFYNRTFKVIGKFKS